MSFVSKTLDTDWMHVVFSLIVTCVSMVHIDSNLSRREPGKPGLSVYQ
jgi:hypothetical protein